MSDLDKLFEQWLDGSLSEAERQSAEAEFAKHPQWQTRVDMAQEMVFVSQTAEPQKVPQWDRSAGFETDHKPWWQWTGLPVLSTAFSFAALLLVIFKVNIQVNEQGLLVSFGEHGNQEQAIAQLVDEKLNAFSQQQQITLANYSVEQVSKQQESNLQLARYILETSRQERKEDMSDFISYISEQRKSDLHEIRLRYRQLEDTVQYQSRTLNTHEMMLQPASWTVEE